MFSVMLGKLMEAGPATGPEIDGGVLLAAKKRKSLTKKQRFEVFKRDSFKCQYCGSEAPGVILVVDHIKPVSAGGTNRIGNLVTACEPCNQGKGPRELSDDSALKKQRTQIEMLQERREQLEMMLAWHDGVADIAAQEAQAAADKFGAVFGWFVSEPPHIKKWRSMIRRHGLQMVLSAIDIAYESYAVFTDKETITQDSATAAWQKIDGICKMEKLRTEDPTRAEILHIRSYGFKKLRGYPGKNFVDNCEAALSWGVRMEAIWALVRRHNAWWQVEEELGELYEEAKAQREGRDG